MSRSNYDKPFYVDVGTSIVAIRCASNHDVVAEYDHAWSKVAKDICDRMNEEAEIGNIGDCAKLRETLENAAKELINATEDENFGEDVMYLVGCMRTVSQKCRAALAPVTEQKGQENG